jgi:hypothetical protein
MNLLDLLDEILLYILNKMNVADALFRQSGLDQLLFDPVYARELEFKIKSWNGSISSMDDLVFDRVFEKILTSINDKIIERILNNINYPKVSSLSKCSHLSVIVTPMHCFIRYLSMHVLSCL